MKVRKKLSGDEGGSCFEIFGYDFLIDCQFKVWLIEVNTNPCLELSSAVLRTLLPRMLGICHTICLHSFIDDAFRLTIDVVFPHKRRREGPETYDASLPSPYPVPGYSDLDNLWECLCQIGIFKAATGSLSKSSPKPPPDTGRTQSLEDVARLEPARYFNTPPEVA
jgi:hypothetical protein